MTNEDYAKSILVHTKRLHAALLVADSVLASKTLFIRWNQLDLYRQSMQTVENVVIFGPSMTNTSGPNTWKISKTQLLEVYSKAWDVSTSKIQDVLFAYFVPGLNFTVWETGGSDDFADYAEAPGGPVIQDFRETGGYNKGDGGRVETYALDLRMPR